MPYVTLSTNIEIDAQQSSQLLTGLSRVVTDATGKPERYVMVRLSGGDAMLFGGNDQPLAYLECKSIGLTAAQAKTLSAALSALLTATLPLSAERIYIEFSDCPAAFWGWNGSTFA